MYHIKNLTNIDCTEDPIRKELTYTENNVQRKLEDSMTVTDMFPVIVHGIIYIVLSMKSISEKLNVHQKSLLIILKAHKTEDDDEFKMEQIYEKLLID